MSTKNKTPFEIWEDNPDVYPRILIGNFAPRVLIGGSDLKTLNWWKDGECSMLDVSSDCPNYEGQDAIRVVADFDDDRSPVGFNAVRSDFCDFDLSFLRAIVHAKSRKILSKAEYGKSYDNEMIADYLFGDIDVDILFSKESLSKKREGSSFIISSKRKALSDSISSLEDIFKSIDYSKGAELLGLVTDSHNTIFGELQKMVDEASASKPSKVPEASKITIKGAKVTIDGNDYKKISAPDESKPYIPTPTDGYNFSAWNASRSVGGNRFDINIHDIMSLILNHHRVNLNGPTGCGKTSALVEFAALLGWPVFRMNGTKDTGYHDYVGTYEAADGKTIWVDGLLTRAMKLGGLFINDDGDRVPAECSQALAAILEPKGKLTITTKGGEVIEPHENFRIVGTQNAGFHGDTSGLYSAAQVQDAQVISRYGVSVEVDYPKQKDEASIVQYKSGLDQGNCNMIVTVANDTRSAAKSGELQYPLDMRQCIAWASVSKELGSLGKGYLLTVSNKVPDTEVAAHYEIAQRHFGDLIAS